jgi:agmatine deiminase
VASSLGLERIKPGVVLEGGAVEFNGKGTVLTTSSCLLNKNRNPGMSRETMESILQDYFGIHQVLWLPQGIAGDDTDGHIDTITRFVNPHTVVTVVADDPVSINYHTLKENLAALRKMKLPGGAPLNVLTLPMPKVRFNEGHQLPCTYANFYICNGAVLVPTYNDKNDKVALEVLSQVFQNREIVGIDSSEIIRGLGSFHCLCMQEPL